MMVVPDEAALQALGREWGGLIAGGCVVYFHGNLGAGKTTLIRAMLAGMGYQGRVKSPTYTLVEPYRLDSFQAYHLDLYRLADPEELEYLGIRDYAAEAAVMLIEWPEKGAGCLPAPDVEVYLDHAGEGRRIRAVARSESGKNLIPRQLWESAESSTGREL